MCVMLVLDDPKFILTKNFRGGEINQSISDHTMQIRHFQCSESALLHLTSVKYLQAINLYHWQSAEPSDSNRLTRSMSNADNTNHSLVINISHSTLFRTDFTDLNLYW